MAIIKTYACDGCQSTTGVQPHQIGVDGQWKVVDLCEKCGKDFDQQVGVWFAMATREEGSRATRSPSKAEKAEGAKRQSHVEKAWGKPLGDLKAAAAAKGIEWPTKRPSNAFIDETAKEVGWTAV